MADNQLEFPLNLESSQPNPQASEKKHHGLKFLNYFSKDKELEDVNANIQKSEIKEIEEKYQKDMKEFIQQFLNEESKPLNILPKKPNVDLKRFLKPQMEKLNRRTEKAIVKLLKQKFQKDSEEEKNQKQVQQPASKKSKLEIENEEIQNFRPVYQAGGQIYDQELYDEEEQFQNFQDGSGGDQLVKALDADYNIFNNFEEDGYESD